MKAIKPRKLEVEISGFFSSCFWVRLTSKGLECAAGEGGFARPDIKIITPSDEQWHEFRRAMDEIEVWVWAREYYAPAMDGKGWM